MVNQHEREKLTEAFKREPLTGAAVVVKCVAGLLIVAGLAVIGVRTDTTDATATAANQPRSQGYEKASVAHGKTLYQERLMRMEPTLAGFAIQILTAYAADTRPNQKSSLTQRGAAPVNSLRN